MYVEYGRGNGRHKYYGSSPVTHPSTASFLLERPRVLLKYIMRPALVSSRRNCLYTMSEPPSQCPLNESIREFDDDSWLIGDDLRLFRQTHPLPGRPCWSDGNGSYFVLVKAATPLPESRPLSETSPLQKVYDAGDVSSVWRAGEAFIKVKAVTIPEATREHATLGFLHRRGPLSFDIPEVYHHSESDGRYYIVLSRLPGHTLEELWPGLDEKTKDEYACRVAGICEELSAWTGPNLSGVDGRHLPDLLLTKPDDGYCGPEHLVTNSKELGMDCSSFRFYHCDLAPSNVIVNPTDGSIGIIDWETAGFVPREWIRSKFHSHTGMDLPYEDFEDRIDWRRRVIYRLADMGYPEVASRWKDWWTE